MVVGAYICNTFSPVIIAALQGWGFRRALSVIAVASAFLAVSSPVRAEEVRGVLDKGHFGSRHWFGAVAGASQRKGICLSVGSYSGSPRSGVSSAGQCSAPAPRRGILIALAQPAHGKPAMTAIVGAFNRAVSRIEEVPFTGSPRMLSLGKGERRFRGTPLNRYRYLAMAVRGPWCVKELRTYGQHGELLWDVGFREIMAPPSKAAFDPAVICE